MIRGLVFVVVLLGALPALAEDAPVQPEVAAAPAPDCSVFSLEGVRLRMTMADAKAATPGWKWTNRRDGRMSNGDRWTAIRTGKGPNTRLDVYFGEDGRVREARRDYVHLSAGFAGPKAEAEVSLSSLEAALQGRVGSVSERGQGSVINGADPLYGDDAVYTMTCWTSAECNRLACIEEGKRWITTGAGPALEIPILSATIIDGAVIDAEVSAGAEKVKF